MVLALCGRVAQSIDIEVNVGGRGHDTLQRLAHDAGALERAALRMDAGWKTSTAGLRGTLDAFGGLRTSIGGVLGPMAAVATAAIDGAEAFVRLAREGNDTQRALARLGDAHSLIRDATNQTVSAQGALSARLTLTNSGLRVSGQELATVARYAREHRQATETSEQALQRLSDALRGGEQEGLRSFGISVQQGASRARTFESALRQMQRAAHGTGPAARTLAEDIDRTSAAFNDGKAFLADYAAEAIHLQGVISGVGDAISDVIRNVRELRELRQDLPAQQRSQDARQGAMTRLRDAQAQAVRAGAAVGVGTRDVNIPLAGLTVAQIDATAARLRAAAATAGGFAGPSSDDIARNVRLDRSAPVRVGAGGRVDRSSVFAGVGADGDLEAGSQRALAALRPGARAAAARVLEGELSRIANDATRMSRDATRQHTERRDSAPSTTAAPNPADVARAMLGLQRLNDQIASDSGGQVFRSMGGRVGAERELKTLLDRAEDTTRRAQENELQHIQRITSARQEYHRALMDELQERSRVQQGLDQRESEAITRNIELRRRALAQALTDIQNDRAEFGQDQTDAQMQVDRRSSSYAGGALARFFRAGDPEERQRRLTSQQLAYKTAIGQNEQAIEGAQQDVSRARTEADRIAAEQHRNELIQQRITLYGQLQQVEQQQLEIDRESTQYTREFSDAMVSALGSTADAFAGAAVAALEGSKSMSEALNEVLRETLKSLAKESIVQTLKHLAIGTGLLAVGNVPGATNAFAAAGLWTAVGVASGAGVAAMGPPPEKGKAAAGRSGDSGRAASPDRPRGGSDAGQPLVLNISVSGALFNEGVGDAIVEGLDHAASRGVLPRYAQTIPAAR